MDYSLVSYNDTFLIDLKDKDFYKKIHLMDINSISNNDPNKNRKNEINEIYQFFKKNQQKVEVEDIEKKDTLDNYIRLMKTSNEYIFNNTFIFNN